MIPGEMVVISGFCAAVYISAGVQYLQERKEEKQMNMKSKKESNFSLKRQRNTLSEIISKQNDQIKVLARENDRLAAAKAEADERASEFKWQLELLRAENARLERQNSLLLVENMGDKRKAADSMTVTAVEVTFPASKRRSIFTQERRD